MSADGVFASPPRPRPVLETVAGWRRAWLGMDRNPRVLAFARSGRGTVILHAAFFAVVAAGLQLTPLGFALIVAALIGCAAAPKRRKTIAAAAGLAFILAQPFRTDGTKAVAAELARHAGGILGRPFALQLAAVLAFLLVAFLVLQLQRRYPGRLIGRRPVLFLILCFSVLLGAALLLPVGTTLHLLVWTVTMITAASLWHLGYAMGDQRAGDPTPQPVRLGFLRPFWGGSTVPFGKGPRFLSKFEAKDETDLAVARLKALKLAVWSLILVGLHNGLVLTVHDLGLPTFREALSASMAGLPPDRLAGWISVLTGFATEMLAIAVWGHTIVAVVRMAGYAVPRNMVRPLQSRTLAEFWNRYFFYFKELLVDFFFYPAFTRYFKKSPKVRIAFATFCAAGLGNLLYHFLMKIDIVASDGILEAAIRFQTYAFYCAVLALGIIISQWRGAKPAPQDGFWRYDFLPRLNVILFFCLLKVFDDPGGAGTLTDRFAFLAHLFGAR